MLVQFAVNLRAARIRINGRESWAEGCLGLFDRCKRADSEKGKNGRSEARGLFLRQEDRNLQGTSVNAIDDRAALRDASRVNNPVDRYAVLGKPLQDDAGMQSGSFHGGK